MNAPTLSTVLETWPTLERSQPTPGTICDWFFIKGDCISHGKGKWQTVHHGIAFAGDRSIPIQGGAFRTERGLAVYDPKSLHWREVQS